MGRCWIVTSSQGATLHFGNRCQAVALLCDLMVARARLGGDVSMVQMTQCVTLTMDGVVWSAEEGDMPCW